MEVYHLLFENDKSLLVWAVQYVMVVLNRFVAGRTVLWMVWVNTVLVVSKWEEMVDPFRDEEAVVEIEQDQGGAEQFPIDRSKCGVAPLMPTAKVCAACRLVAETSEVRGDVVCNRRVLD